MATIRITMPPVPAHASPEEHLDAVLLQIAQVVAEWPDVGEEAPAQENYQVFSLDEPDAWHARVEGDNVVITTNLPVRDDVQAAMKLVIDAKLDQLPPTDNQSGAHHDPDEPYRNGYGPEC